MMTVRLTWPPQEGFVLSVKRGLTEFIRRTGLILI